MPPYFPQPFPHQLHANPANFTSRLPLFHICGTILALGLGLGLRSGARCVTHRHRVFVVKEEKEDDGGSAIMASTIPYTVMEGFTHIYAKLSVYLHPSRPANVQQGVREIINSLLLRKKSSCYFQSPASSVSFSASLIFLSAELGSIFNAQTDKLFLPELSTESETQCSKKKP